MIQGSPALSAIAPPSGAPVQVYRIARGWKIFLVLAALPLVFLAGWLMLLPFLDGRTGETGFVLLCLGLGGGGVLFLFYVLVSVFRSRIEIHPDRIRDVGALRSVELPLHDIGGYRIVPTQYVTMLQLWPENPAQGKISLSLVIERKEEFVAWVEAHFPDLDARDAEEELKQFLDDTRPGENSDERQRMLKRAHLWTKILNGTCYVALLWALFYPEPYHALIWTLLLLPWGALLLLRLFPGAIGFNASRNTPLPDITPALLMPALGLALRAVIDFAILDWGHFWQPFAVLALLYGAPALLIARSGKRKVVTIGLLFVFAAVYGYGATITLNGVLDHSRRSTFYATVTDKHVSHGKHTSYYLKLSPWGPRPAEEEVDVGRETYERHQVGDRVAVVLRQGRFAIPWYYVGN